MAIEQNILVTVDALVVVKEQVLLIQRLKEPFQGMWALPGGFVEDDEDLTVAAARELMEETGVEIPMSSMSQFGTYGKPGRDPRGRTVSVVYVAELDQVVEANGADDAADAKWFSWKRLPPLAFDHAEILEAYLADRGA